MEKTPRMNHAMVAFEPRKVAKGRSIRKNFMSQIGSRNPCSLDPKIRVLKILKRVYRMCQRVLR